MVLESDFQGVVKGGTSLLEFINSIFYRSGVSSLKLMEQKIGFEPKSFLMQSNNFLIDGYNEVIRRLRDAGITDHWVNLHKKRQKLSDSVPQVLDMERLEVCFYVCMVSLAAATLCFMCELLFAKTAHFRCRIKSLIRERIRRGFNIQINCRKTLITRKYRKKKIVIKKKKISIARTKKIVLRLLRQR